MALDRKRRQIHASQHPIRISTWKVGQRNGGSISVVRQFDLYN